jgi:S-DNA-T family DNA segregation ATPase FtsK/SpoIIIE
VSKGPAITRYELQPARGVKVSRITGLADDIALNMAAVGVRIEAPIPGKAAIGIEIANSSIDTVTLREVLESKNFVEHPSKLAFSLGKDISGEAIVADLARMPHLLIAGATGSGKSVCINSLIASILYKATPEEVRLILIDPKVVELSVYNGIPHLLIPVVTDPKKAAGALGWAVAEMTERYKLFAKTSTRDLKGYNSHTLQRGGEPLPQIVVVIDELADLMMVASGDVEDRICRLAQLARAAGIHLVIATQRPSVNVITGVIKANIPARIAFAVASQVDSRTILDVAGADKLLGRGDMLFAPGNGKSRRVQGAFITDEEVTTLVEYIKARSRPDYDPDFIEAIEKEDGGGAKGMGDDDGDDGDDLLAQAVELAIDSGQISASMLQRRFRVGYARAGRLLDEMEKRKLISGFEGSKPRQVLIGREEYDRIFGNSNFSRN